MTGHRLSAIQDAECEELARILTRPGPGGVIVLGGLGMGKTTLVREILERHGMPIPIMRLHCTPSLWDEAFGALSPYLTNLESIEGTIEVFREITALLRRNPTPDDTPIVVVEDAQFLDAESSYVLSALVENNAIKLIAIGSGRLDGYSTLFSLAESGTLSILVVKPLDAEGVSNLAAEIIGGRLTGAALEAVLAMSGGNPSFVKAFLLSGVEQSLLVRDGTSKQGEGGLWSLAQISPNPDERLIDLVRDMSASLHSMHRATLELLALAGPQPRELLVGVAGPSYRHLLESGILRTSDNKILIAAEIHATVLRHMIAPGRSAELYGKWMEQRSERSVETDPTPMEVCWSLEVGAEVNQEAVIAAIKGAIGNLNYPLAWRLSSLAGLSMEQEEGTLLEARILVGLGRHYSARAVLMRLAERSQNPAVLEEIMRGLFVGMDQLGSEYDDLVAVQGYWRKLIGSETADYRKLVTIAQLWRRAQDSAPSAALAMAASGLLSDPAVGPEGRIAANMMLSDLHSLSGRSETALEYAIAARDELIVGDLAEASGLAVTFQIGWCLALSGRYSEALALIHDYRGDSPRSVLARYGTLHLLQGLVEKMRGQVGLAARDLSEAVAELRLRDSCNLLPFALASRGSAEHLSPKAKARGAWVSAGLTESVPPPRRILVRAAVTAYRGRDTDSTTDFPIVERVRLGYRMGQLRPEDPEFAATSKRLAAVAGRMEGSRAHLLSRLTTSLDDPEMAEELAKDAEEAGEYAVAARALAAAALASSENNGRHSGVLVRELMILLSSHQVIPEPYVSRALALAELTSREVEIVELSQKGKNNGEIARALTVSQRTVEGHLYRVFSKLGITDRSQLVDLPPLTGDWVGSPA